MGVCKLCLKTKTLQDSHLIPRAMYKYLRQQNVKNPNPMVVGRNVSGITSPQMFSR